MINSRNRYVITYNGEIYNFRELRSNLSKLGYLFRSDTDSEVLLEAFNEWGINILNKLN
jgi:asparagine synthase (glutamine-hydrolysing)